MIVVSDTSPLNYLAMLSRLEILPALFDKVLVPAAVMSELKDGLEQVPQLEALFSAPWLEESQVVPAHRLPVADPLGPGEAAAISLALALNISLVLMDERDGRAAATACGLTPVGVGGVLVRAKHRGLIATVRPELDWLLTNTNFHLQRATRRQILEMAGEL